MEQVKIDKNDAGVIHPKKLPVFTAKHGVEGLFHVVDKNDKEGQQLNFTVTEYWNFFENVLDTVAESKWKTK